MVVTDMESQSFFPRDIIDHLHDGLVVLDSDGSIVCANSAAERLFGQESGNLIGQSLGIPVINGVESEIEIFSTSEPVKFVKIIPKNISRNGQSFTLCFLRDISIWEAAERLNLALETGHIGLWEWNSKLDTIKADSKLFEILECRNEACMSSFENLRARIHPDDLPKAMESWSALLGGLIPSLEVEYKTLTDSGKYKPVLNRARVINTDSEGNATRVFGAMMDMTEHQKVLNAERVSSLKYQTLVNNIPLGMAYVNRSGDILLSNSKFRQIFNLSQKEKLTPVNLFKTFVFIRSEISRLLEESINKGSDISSTTTHSPLHGDVQTLKCLIATIPDATGEILGCQILVEDITEHEKSRRILLENEKLKVLEELASGVAHNFNNLLQIIVGSTNLAMRRIHDGELKDAKGQLRKILDQCRLGAATVQKLQDFAGIGASDEGEGGEKFDLTQVVNKAVEMTRQWWKTDPALKGIQIKLFTELSPDLWGSGEADDFLEVAINLIKNAAEAMSQGGVLTVTTTQDGDNLLFEVEDSGVGIPPENRQKIFQPFWTTKGYQKSGLGLSSSLGIIKRYGGTLSLKPAENHGTRACVVWPASNFFQPCEQELPDSQSMNLRILCVDDDDSILDLLREGLEMYGHQVITASSGQSALEMFLADRFDLVICDLGMPELTGWDVGSKIRDICLKKGVPKTLFLLLTGWGGQSHNKEKIINSGVDAVLTKPISFSELNRIINLHKNSG